MAPNSKDGEVEYLVSIQTQTGDDFRVFQNGYSNSALVTNRNGVWRGTWGTFALILALNEAVGDTKNRVNDDCIDTFSNLVL